MRIIRDAPSVPSHPPLHFPQLSSQTRGLHASIRRNDGFLCLLTTLIEAPLFHESTVSESTVPESTVAEPTGDPEPTSFGLGTLGLAGQHNRRRSPTITTLNPERLTPTDVIHLPHDAHTFTVSFKPLLDLSSNIGLDQETRRRGWWWQRRRTTPLGFIPRRPSIASRQPLVPHEVTLRAVSGAVDLEGIQFPAGPGCLYFHLPPVPCTPLAGALRIRILFSLSADPKSWTDQAVRDAFTLGSDFCVLPDVPWHVPLLTLTGGSAGSGYDAVRAMLLHERLVAPSVMRDAEREEQRWGFKRHGSRVIHAFGQPFIVDLSTRELTFYFVGQRRVYQHTLPNLCSWNLPGSNEAYQPFTGRLMCAFQRWKSPTKTEKLFVAIRILKVLSPVRRNPRYSGPQDIPRPKADTLLRRGIRQRAPHRSSGTHRGKPEWGLWLANVNTVYPGMRVLFENDSEGMPGETLQKE